MTWLSRRGLLRDAADADAANAPPEQSAAEALASAGMQRGSLLTVRESSDSFASLRGSSSPPIESTSGRGHAPCTKKQPPSRLLSSVDGSTLTLSASYVSHRFVPATVRAFVDLVRTRGKRGKRPR
jgi:hypothetical protein